MHPNARAELSTTIRPPPWKRRSRKGISNVPLRSAMFAEGWLCTASPFRGRGALLREFPAPPPQDGYGLPRGGPAGDLLMAHVSDLIATDIEQYLRSHEKKSLLRFIICGSVDDGKSTLIGRLLYESKMLFEDQLAAVEADSRKYGTQGENIDFALLVDGLAAEREQGITIDVAYRFFSTDKRKFIVADTPGHEQYTRNMVTGASTADVAVLMVDARKGILTQTRRHSYLVSLIGIRHIVVAVNKMDLVDYSEKTFRHIVEDYREFAAQIGLEDVTFIPMSAFKGDNIIAPSDAMPGYHRTTLMGYLETVEIDETRIQQLPFRLPVQWVNRPNLDFRGFAGTVASGVVKPGDKIRVQPSGKQSTVARIVTQGGDMEKAVAGQSITLTLADEIDISRGDAPHPHLHLFGDIDAEFLQHSARIDHCPRPIGRGFVPHRRQPEHRPRIAGAERAYDHVVHPGRVLENHHVFALAPDETEFGDGGRRIVEQPLLVGGIAPRPRDDLRAVARPDPVLVSFDKGIERPRLHQSLVGQKRFERLYPQRRAGKRTLVCRGVAIAVRVFGHQANDSGRLIGALACCGHASLFLRDDPALRIYEYPIAVPVLAHRQIIVVAEPLHAHHLSARQAEQCDRRGQILGE